ncbi:MAG: hypothetical protein HY917_01660 [Candidatus Diapherotrites archaeon]|nr:hypothetical protein [Candidatus Diapherotrites archaeon]
MLDFILSKLNLLILAVALFGIVSFFALALIEKSTASEANFLLSQLVHSSQQLAESPSYCSSVSLDLPSSINVTGNEFFYVLKLSVVSLGEQNGRPISEVVYSFVPRREYRQFQLTHPERVKAIAANSFRTSANVYLYELGPNPNSDSLSSYFSNPGESVFVDPQARPGENDDTLRLIKDVVGGKTYLHVIACNHSACDITVGLVEQEFVKWVNSEQGLDRTGFNCTTRATPSFPFPGGVRP